MTKDGTLKIERERKFLVNADMLPANFVESEHYSIEQCYLTEAGDSVEIRIRTENKGGMWAYYMTIKRGKGLERKELEIPIDNRLIGQLIQGTQNIIRKERFLAEFKGYIIEVDVYDYNPKESLNTKNIVAEIEIGNKDQYVDLELPYWIGKEVTGRPEYSNQEIAFNGFPKKERE